MSIHFQPLRRWSCCGCYQDEDTIGRQLETLLIPKRDPIYSFSLLFSYYIIIGAAVEALTNSIWKDDFVKREKERVFKRQQQVGAHQSVVSRGSTFIVSRCCAIDSTYAADNGGLSLQCKYDGDEENTLLR